MLFFLLTRLLTSLIDLLHIAHFSSDDKDLEILILRQQLDILARKENHAVRPSRQEKWPLAVLAASLKRARARKALIEYLMQRGEFKPSDLLWLGLITMDRLAHQ